jgi:hypothetical protein
MQRALDRGTTNPATANALLNVALNRVITDDRLTPRDLLSLAQAMRNLDTSGVSSYTVEWSMRRIGGESVLIPVTDTESMQAILAVFRGEGDVARVSADAGADGDAFAPPSMRTALIDIVPLTHALIDALSRPDSGRSSTDTTLPIAPVQERLGVFPPNDPACR